MLLLLTFVVVAVLYANSNLFLCTSLRIECVVLILCVLPGLSSGAPPLSSPAGQGAGRRGYPILAAIKGECSEKTAFLSCVRGTEPLLRRNSELRLANRRTCVYQKKSVDETSIFDIINLGC